MCIGRADRPTSGLSIDLGMLVVSGSPFFFVVFRTCRVGLEIHSSRDSTSPPLQHPRANPARAKSGPFSRDLNSRRVSGALFARLR